MFKKLQKTIEHAAYTDITFLTEIQATRALLKFCEEHKHFEVYLGHLRDCLQALERREPSTAVEAFRRLPAHKDGFYDWWPPVAFEHETRDYAIAVFQSLGERYSRLMSRHDTQSKKS